MNTVKVHFDGKVFVPDSPVDLPVGFSVDISLPTAEPRESASKPLAELREKLAQLPANPDWPEDGAQNVDHYLYGMPKQK